MSKLIKKKEIDNGLQVIDKQTAFLIKEKTKDAIGKIGSLSVFNTKKSDINNIVDSVFKDIDYSKQLEKIVLSATISSADLALKDYGTVVVDKYIERELAKTYKGVSLSKAIRGCGKETSLQVSALIKSEINKGTNWKKLAIDISNKDTVSDVSKRIISLSEKAQKMGVDISKERKAAIKYVESLSLNGAPNQQLKKAYSKLIKAVESRDSDIIKNALDKAVNSKITYNAQRIARTEMAESYNEAFMARLDDDPDATGYEWVISSRHPAYDECDFFANLDNGAGKGVYKKGDFPSIPAHPNCLCSLVLYYGDSPKMTSKSLIKKTASGLPKIKSELILGKKTSGEKTMDVKALEKKISHVGGQVRKLPLSLVNKSNKKNTIISDDFLEDTFVKSASKQKYIETLNTMSLFQKKLLLSVNPPKELINSKKGFYTPAYSSISSGYNKKDVLFHEYGHHIDHELGKKIAKKSNLIKELPYSASDSFSKALDFDFKGFTSKYNLEDLKKKCCIITEEKIRRGNRVLTYKVTKGISENLKALSDIIDAATDGVFFSIYHAPGHGINYYKKPYRRNLETFANLFLLKDTPEWDDVKSLFPNIAKEFDKIKKEL